MLVDYGQNLQMKKMYNRGIYCSYLKQKREKINKRFEKQNKYIQFNYYFRRIFTFNYKLLILGTLDELKSPGSPQ